jgi:hypothetical protein
MRMPLQSCSLPLAALALLFAIAPANAHAQNTPVEQWMELETGISVKFTQVNGDMCTWSFKNTDTTSPLTYMKFAVTHPDWKPGQVFNPYSTKTDKDVMPNPLKPGEVWGGWATYSAPGSCAYVRIEVLDRTWR